MQTSTLPLMVFVIFTFYLQYAELNSSSSRSERKEKRCIDTCQCPNGSACLFQDIGKRRKTCQECSCRLPEQCQKLSDEIICDCSDSGYTGSNCESPLEQPCQECPDGWNKSGCSCYLYVTTPADWLTANDNCKSKFPNSHLVEIKSSDENDFIYSVTGYHKFWIGLTDRDVEGTFVWEYSKSEDIDFHPEYFDTGRESDDCISAFVSAWLEFNCGYELAYICELSLQTVDAGEVTDQKLIPVL